MTEADRGQTPPKRQRVSQACNACRRKKSRCNGRRPKCSSCSDLGISCEYLNDAHTRGTMGEPEGQPGQVDALVQRMEDLERRLARSEAQQRHQSTLQATPLARSLVTPDCSTVAEGSPAVEATPRITSTDGMAHFVHAGAADPGYFGPSSNIALMRDISEAGTRILEPFRRRASVHRETSQTGLSRTEHPPSPALHNSRVGKAFTISKPASPRPYTPDHVSGPATDLYVLPDESRVQRLLQRYFAETGALFPYLIEKEFVATYNAWRQRQRMVQPSWIALLNIVFALAVHTTWTPDEQDPAGFEARHDESALYFGRARQLCPLNSLEHTTVETVQCLLLMAQYLQGTPSSITTWAVHGLAVKAAMQLGLHSGAAAAELPAVERERRKRTWYGCIIVDRTLSMTFGRPPIVPQEYVKLSLPEDIPSPGSSTPQGVSKSSGIQFFSATIKLYQITGTVLTKLFDNNLEIDQPDRAEDNMTEVSCQTLKCEEEMRTWSLELPGHLRLIEKNDTVHTLGDDIDTQNIKFRVILTLCYHNLNVLLHRPILKQALTAIKCEQSVDRMSLPAGSKAVFLSALRSALDSAASTIGLVHSIMLGPVDRRCLLGAWWFVLYYTFNAALVVFGCAMLASHSTECRDEFTVTSGTLRDKQALIRHAAEALEGLYNSNGRGAKCALCLRQLEVLIGHMVAAADTSTKSSIDPPAGSSQEHFADPQMEPALSAERAHSSQPSIPLLDSSLDPPVSTLDGWDPFNLDFLLGYDPVLEASPLQQGFGDF